jgi:predicted Zn-dependent protease
VEQRQFQNTTHRLGVSKLGQRILDERITISHDPSDPELGVVPFSVEASAGGIDVEPYHPVTWVRNGVLQTLSYDRDYALRALAENNGAPNSGAFRMSGGGTSTDEMIATTPRGLLVTRFSALRLVDGPSRTYTGVTRDGLWLIEHGKIKKAVKNMRFSDSPLFVFNNVEQLGAPMQVFSPSAPAIVPTVKARDFNFISLVDAI